MVGVFSKTRVAIVYIRRILELAVFSRRVVSRRVGRAPVYCFTVLQSICHYDLVFVIELMNLIRLSSSSVNFSSVNNVRVFTLLFGSICIIINAIV